MNDEAEQDGDAVAQAAQWHARLSTLPVSRETLEAFFAWNRILAHREAFEAVDTLNTRVKRLAGRSTIEAATEAAYRRGVRHRQEWRRPMQAASLCTALLLVAGISWNQWRTGRETFATSVGEQREVELQDGSTIMLDSDTRLSIRFLSGARNVQLEQGQAFFTVAHDTTRPFTVRAGDTSVVATGTQFDVQRTGSATLVALLRGGVDVRSEGHPVAQLTPGQQWRAPADGPAVVEPVASSTITAWMNDRIVLDNVPLADAIARVNRHLGQPIVLDTQDQTQARFSGSLKAGDAQGFVAAVAGALPLEAVKDEDGAIHLRDRSPPIQPCPSRSGSAGCSPPGSG